MAVRITYFNFKIKFLYSSVSNFCYLTWTLHSSWITIHLFPQRSLFPFWDSNYLYHRASLPKVVLIYLCVIYKISTQFCNNINVKCKTPFPLLNEIWVVVNTGGEIIICTINSLWLGTNTKIKKTGTFFSSFSIAHTGYLI